MRALVLSGGGGRGAYEMGVYKAYAEREAPFDIVAGTSVGAITAAAIVSGLSVDEIEAMWSRLHTFRVVHPRPDFWRFLRWTHLVSSKPLLKFLEKELDYDAIARSPTQIRVTATDVGSGDTQVWTNEELTPNRLLASASIPILFPMAEDEGRHYWDGGAVMNTPVQPAIEAGATEVTTVLLSPLGARDLPPPRNLWEAIARTTDLTLLGNLKQDIKQTEMVNRLIAAGEVGAPFRHVDFDIVGPESTLGITTFFNFSGRKAVELIDWGHQDGIRHLDGRTRTRALDVRGPEAHKPAA